MAQDGPGAEEIMDALERIVSDPDAGSRTRAMRLLRYIVTEAVEGRAASLKGTSIAMDVFGRGTDFDPQTDAIVRTEARRLRQLLATYYVGRGATDPVIISVPKGGYTPRFARRAAALADDDPASVTAGPDENAAGMSAQPVNAAKRPALVWSRFWVWTWSLGGVAVAAAFVLFLMRPVPIATDTVSLSGTPIVAILPFEKGDTGDVTAAMAEGLWVKLVADLMRFPGFRVFTAADGSRWDEGLDAEVNTQKAGTTYTVRGLVQREGEQLSVVVRLSDAFDGRVLWSDAYVRRLEPGALVELQAEISGEIATALGHGYGAIRTAQSSLAADAAGSELSSFECVLAAYTYRHTNRHDLYGSTKTCLEQAVLADPEYAEAWAMLAYLRLDSGRFGYEARTEEERVARYGEAKAAALQSLSLEPDGVNAIMALSTIEHYLGRYSESQRLAREAIDLNPNDPDALAQYGWRLVLRGELDEGIVYLERAIDRSARPPWWYYQAVALERLMKGDMDGMLAAAERAALDGSAPSQSVLAIAHAGVGNQVAAAEAVERMAQKWPLLGTDPAAAYAQHHLREDMVDALVDGLRRAGWRPTEDTAHRNTTTDHPD